MKRLKKAARSLQNYLETKVLSNSLEKLLWGTKHIYRPKWDQISVNSHNLAHRHGLISKIMDFEDINSVLEVGRAAGPNLRLLRSQLPKANLMGCDINPKCISTGNSFFSSKGDTRTKLYKKSTDQLDFFKNKSIDVVFTQGCLLLLPPGKIYSTLENLVGLSKKGLILHELHKDGAANGYFDEGRWGYDYVQLIKKISPRCRIELYDSTFKGGSWETYGKIIKITLLRD